MGITTKRGDWGKTSVFDGEKLIRVSKGSKIIEAIGRVDQANSYLGIIKSELTKARKGKKEVTRFTSIFEKIQGNLFVVGAILAGSKLKFESNEIKNLESSIDGIESTIPVQRNFILPGGEKIASHLFYMRTLVRSAERSGFLVPKKTKELKKALIYLNRLSDYIFLLARQENLISSYKESVWRSDKS